MQLPCILGGILTILFCDVALAPSARFEAAFMKLLDPDYCRKQAKEVGAQSEELRNHSVKRDLIRITRSYSLLAELAENRRRDGKQAEGRRIPTQGRTV